MSSVIGRISILILNRRVIAMMNGGRREDGVLVDLSVLSLIILTACSFVLIRSLPEIVLSLNRAWNSVLQIGSRISFHIIL